MAKRQFGQEHGFTMTELMLAVAIGLIVMGMAMGGVPGLIKTARADGGLANALSGLRAARELAISSRRNVRVTFGTNSISATRVEYCPSTCTTGATGTWSTLTGCTNTCTSATTVVRTMTLEGRAEFRKPPAAITLNTGDGFPNAAADGINLGSLVPAMFTTDGSLIDTNGDLLNGTIFIGVPDDILSTRAISIFGATGAMHLWRWNGRAWVEM